MSLVKMVYCTYIYLWQLRSKAEVLKGLDIALLHPDAKSLARLHFSECNIHIGHSSVFSLYVPVNILLIFLQTDLGMLDYVIHYLKTFQTCLSSSNRTQSSML